MAIFHLPAMPYRSIVLLLCLIPTQPRGLFLAEYLTGYISLTAPLVVVEARRVKDSNLHTIVKFCSTCLVNERAKNIWHCL